MNVEFRYKVGDRVIVNETHPSFEQYRGRVAKIDSSITGLGSDAYTVKFEGGLGEYSAFWGDHLSFENDGAREISIASLMDILA